MPTGAEAKGVAAISSDGHLSTAQEQTSRKGFCSVRHGLALLVHLCNFLINSQRMSLSIAMPAMVNSTAQLRPLNASAERPPADSQDGWNGTLQQSEAVAPMYDWSPEIQGIILSSYNYASFLVPIPTGYIAGIFGAKYLVGVNLLLSSVLALLIPLAADAGVLSIIVLRIFQGMAQVIVLTSQFSLWVKWAPPLEKSQLVNIAVSGQLMGSFITLLIGGFLCQTKGWPSIFYIFGGIGCVCSFLWFLLVYDDPIHHRFISADEKEYIVCSLAQQDCSPGWSLPIKAMIKSLPLWGILVFYFTEFWIFNIVITYLPTYINSVLQANIRDSGILSALLLGAACIGTILGGLLADFLHSRKIFRLVTIRKLSTAIGVLFPSAAFVSLYWVRFSFSASMGLLALSSVTITFCQTGALVNILDIAPRYTSFLQGLLEVFAYSSGAISSTVAGFLISQDSEFGWRNVFLIAVSINMSGLVFYLIFSQAKVQDWATEQMFTQL
ncbi:probable small intestine urate exporter isoform X1 [Meles meles]|uniref:probable small intestine urate exporter isoform X1 n=2 Tax=Meles meles TaxID=9662 RepID=UPI001E698694|nr:probable small intestine urate exporter isoform X1 [Meles meles]XP_045860960.1 probable small intestine urate exporter isoform X1 [Meles meles]XP_045860962.1 probable small intestine urate exporter isoform X1 [Meles meles]